MAGAVAAASTPTNASTTPTVTCGGAPTPGVACAGGATAASGTACELPHFIGAFGVDSPAIAQAASHVGVNAAFIYGDAAPANSAIGAAYNQSGIAQIAGMPEVYLQDFECHRLSRTHQRAYPMSCDGNYPNMTEATLFSDIQQAVTKDATISGVDSFYILDDWPLADTAEAASLLPRVTQLIHQIAPARPTICGFGGSISPNTRPWDDYISAVFDSYTPAGCDLPALEIYSEPTTNPQTAPSAYDWSMTHMLQHMRQDLQKRGWKPAQGFIGVGQAWYGPLGGTSPQQYEVAPTPADMAAQAAGFCHAGALGVVFYKWDASGSQTLRTPQNDPQLASGIQQAGQACQGIWNANGNANG
jgi:hypothetical protein